MNPYSILNVPVTATRDEIRAAYRALARRWHPDRFAEGPERDWANEKMAEINAAYHACLEDNPLLRQATDESHMLTEVEAMIDGGEYERARKTLMALSTRSAEWNYLFGAVLLRLRETEKALIYLSVAAHQNPDSAKYTRALAEAQGRKLSLGQRFSAWRHREV